MKKLSLGSQIKRGIIATAAAKYSDYFLKLIVTAILARLLTPAEFGVVAVVSVLLTFFRILGHAGIGPAVVQYKDLDDKAVSSLFTLSVLFGVVLASLFALSAPVIAHFYDADIYYRLVPVLSLTLLFNILSAIPQSLLRRQRRFGIYGAIIIVSHIVGSGIAIVMAFRGFGVYALVANEVFSTGSYFIFMFIAARVPFRLGFNRAVYSRVFSYSSFQLLYEFMHYFSKNLDKLLIGRYLSAADLGYYEKSYRLMMLPLQTLTHVVTPVLHPVLSQIQDEKERIYSGFLRVTYFLAVIGFPLSSFLVFSAGDLILLIFGKQWLESVPVFFILAHSVGLQMILSSTGAIFQTSGKTNLMFISGFISSAAMIAAILLGIFIGGSSEAVASWLIAAFIVNFFVVTVMLIVGALKQRYFKFLSTLGFPIVTGIAIYGVLFAVHARIDMESFNSFERLFINAGVSACVFLLMAFVTGEWKRNILPLLKKM